MKNTLLLLIAFLSISVLHAQWQPIGPYNASIKCLAKNPTHLFALSETDGFFLSTDNGNNWMQRNNGLPTAYPVYHSLATDGSNLFVGMDNAIFFSTDNGDHWMARSNGLPMNNTRVFSLLATPFGIYAGTSRGIFLSTDQGTNWLATSAGLPNNVAIFSFAISGSQLYAGTSSGVFLSTDQGNNWVAASAELPDNTAVFALAISGSNIFAGTNGGVFLSTNTGGFWALRNNGLSNTYVWSLAISGTDIYAGTANGLFLSNNDGDSWMLLNDVLANSPYSTNRNTAAILLNGSDIFIGGNTGIGFSTSVGGPWMTRNNGLPYTMATTLATNGSIVYATTSSDALYATEDNGSSWERKGGNGSSLKVRDSCVFIGGTSLYVSHDYGDSWMISTGFSDNVDDVVAVAGTTVFAKYNRTDGFISTNNGISFTHDPLPYSIFANRDDQSLFAVGDNAVLFYNGTNWVPVSSLPFDSVYSLVVNATTIFAGTEGGLLLSAYPGTGWSKVEVGLANSKVMGLAVNGEKVYASTDNNDIFASTDNGQHWISVTNNFTDTIITTAFSQVNITPLVINSTHLFVGGKHSIWTRPVSDITDVKDIKEQSDFVIHPNPSTGKFNLSGEAIDAIVMQNMIGKVIYSSFVYKQTSTEIDLSTFPKGVYFISVYQREKKYTRKIIIQ